MHAFQAAILMEPLSFSSKHPAQPPSEADGAPGEMVRETWEEGLYRNLLLYGTSIFTHIDVYSYIHVQAVDI